MIRVLAISFLISPYLPNVLPFLALLGALLFVLLNISYFVHEYTLDSHKDRRKVTSIPLSTGLTGSSGSLVEGWQKWAVGGKKTRRLTQELIVLVLHLFRFIWFKASSHPSLKHWFDQTRQRTNALSSLSSPVAPEEAVFGDVLGPLLTCKTEAVCDSFVEWFTEKRQEGLHEKLWVKCLHDLADYTSLYKRIRDELLKETPGLFSSPSETPKLRRTSSPTRPETHRHMDDFNELQKDLNDELALWSMKTDELNDKIVLRFRAEKKLHPALASDDEHEQNYLRSLFEKVLDALQYQKNGELHPLFTSSRLLSIFSREWIVCRTIGPAIDSLANPDNINRFLIEKAQKRLVIQKAVKNFRGSLEKAFSTFPPLFLFAGGTSMYSTHPNWTVHEKLKLFERLNKYARRVESVIDLKALQHEVLRELRKRQEELRIFLKD